MGRFFTLVSIENIKMWKRLSTKVMLLIMVLIVVAASGIFRFYQYRMGYDVHAAPTISADWRQKLEAEIVSAKEQKAMVEKSKNNAQRSMLGQLDQTIAEDQYRLDHNIPLKAPNSIWTKILDFGENAGYCSLIALMLIIACSAAVAGEFSEGTIKMAISRPYHRHEILSAKLVASLLYGLALLVVTLVTNFILFAIFYGLPGLNAMEVMWTTHQVLYVPAVVKLLAYYGLGFLEVIFYTVLAFALAAVTRSRSISTGFSLFMLLVGGQIAQMVAIYFSWAKWFPFTMSHFSNMMTNGVTVPGSSLTLGLILTGIYTLVFGAVGYIVFAKRDI